MEKAKTRKALGNATEKRVMAWLKAHGYWAHLFAQSTAGQPCDIIAVKGGEAFLFDAKHCEEPRFRLSRVEPNQSTAFSYARRFGMRCAFACEYEGELYLIDWDGVDMGKPSIALTPERIWRE